MSLDLDLPGTEPGVVLDGLGFARLATNDDNQVLFQSSIVGAPLPPSGNTALFLNTDGVNQLLLQRGDTIEASPGEIVTLGNVDILRTGIGRQSGLLGPLNDNGQVVTAAGIPSLSQTVIMILDGAASLPVADAGPDQTVDEADFVTLDGTASSDPQGDALTYNWSQLAGPSISLMLQDPAQPTFTAPFVNANETATFELKVSDGTNVSDPDTVNITIKNANNPPVSDAGDDATLKEGEIASLDGTNSFDPESDPINYQWSQVLGGDVLLSPGADDPQPAFVAPAGIGQTLVFKLVVDDGREANNPSAGADSSFADTVAVTVVENSAPIADAGVDQTRNEGVVVTLNGSGSSDPDGDGIGYVWTQISGPSVVLNNTNSPMPSFTAPAVSLGGQDFVFRLIVTDDDAFNPRLANDDVNIHIANINDPPSCGLAQVDNGVLWPPNHKLLPVSIVGVVDQDGEYNSVSISIANITQDEPVNGQGDGDTSPDGLVQSGSSGVDSALIRAERNGSGNGRVYQINFTAHDGFESCSGVVSVSVPKKRKSTAVDDGQAFDSSVE